MSIAFRKKKALIAYKKLQIRLTINVTSPY